MWAWLRPEACLLALAPHLAGLGEQQVGRLEVAVQHAGGVVDVPHATGELRDVVGAAVSGHTQLSPAEGRGQRAEGRIPLPHARQNEAATGCRTPSALCPRGTAVPAAV